MSKSKKKRSVGKKVFIIVVLILLIFLCDFIVGEEDEVDTYMIRREFYKNEEKYINEAEDLIKSRDYITFAVWYRERNGGNIDELERYRYFNNACSSYSNIYSYIVRMGNYDAMKNRSEEGLEIFCPGIASSYEVILSYIEISIEKGNEENVKYLDAMYDCRDEAKALIASAFSLSKEEIDSLDDINEEELTLLLEENMPYFTEDEEE